MDINFALHSSAVRHTTFSVSIMFCIMGGAAHRPFDALHSPEQHEASMKHTRLSSIHCTGSGSAVGFSRPLSASADGSLVELPSLHVGSVVDSVSGVGLGVVLGTNVSSQYTRSCTPGRSVVLISSIVPPVPKYTFSFFMKHPLVG